MAEISAKSYYHRLQSRMHIFPIFHVFSIFIQKVRAKRKKNTQTLPLSSPFPAFSFLTQFDTIDLLYGVL